ncbi:peptidyl-prolyl cis-trans isomerase, cyclophilin-type protein (macronuclear) [Tetrahymena thermophila SB210]|uniref:peptidylprolyl isomerase n=1 Tax=Tetrahymena thermophila (strain SB210) TaxID=312017 RepID=Q23GA6_TETTS|nr:peptidyl-prolyl cis-trans isomerase, cyclophilin-type protein [Tetrahymena thermophila SB210]EAR95354.1 peptidyl-prolyl cis-trans isomerase, cyclophilin-type protein [Tetrahymena thermophila SB210]|eukprot:XP_001015599.1 peptidyl-prolyl cis-trans isomerase, cyclophilin-type protein [Tetrahymena thermophila SB210]
MSDSEESKVSQNEKKQQLIKQNQQRKQNLESADVGPSVKLLKNIDIVDVLLKNVPSGEMYEKSYMHREVVNMIIGAPKNDTIITISVDGHVKFWRKIYQLIEQIKYFRCHKGPVTGACISLSQDSLITVCASDQTMKKFDLLSTDLNNFQKFDFRPATCQFVQLDDRETTYLCVSDFDSGKINVYDDVNEEKLNLVKTLEIHSNSVRFLFFNKEYDCCVSIDKGGFIEIWDPKTFDFPENSKFKFSSKLQTDYFELLKKQVVPLGACLSNNGQYLAIYGSDKQIRIFNFKTGKIIHTIDESDKRIQEIQDNDQDPEYKLHKLDKFAFSRRMATERETEKIFDPTNLEANSISLQFDENNEMLVYPTLVGIKYYSLSKAKIVQVQGKNEQERFLKLFLYQGKPMKNPSNTGGSQKLASDPLLIASAFKKNRFYLFSGREPEDQQDKILSRDVLNERPSKEEQQMASQLLSQQQEKKNNSTASSARIETTQGDIEVELYDKLVPKTVENFVTHSKNGYYNNLIFHRVIPNFMIQTGCPKGDGTGGESIWGGEFEDEFHPKLKHDKAGTLSMANAGPNTNGSQFFITCNPTEWLDNKHTVFGRVTKGMDIVQQIATAKKDKFDRPLKDIKIRTIVIIS